VNTRKKAKKKAGSLRAHRLEFDEHTRVRLHAAFRKEYLRSRARISTADFRNRADSEAKVFVRCLERLAQARHVYENVQDQKKRRELTEAFANSLDRCIDSALNMDDPSLGYALWRGFEEMVKHPDFSDDDRQAVASSKGYQAAMYAYELQHFYRSHLARFVSGVRCAIRELPPLDISSFEKSTARWIEKYLEGQWIPFSTSDTGLAGEAFLAVMQLAGAKDTGAKYRLSEAAKDQNSYKAWITSMRSRFQK
jgi:hypothetical protein